VWEYHRAEAFNAGLCRAEYVWEAAARAGRRSVVMNYAGYPPTTDAAVHIDWLFQPARSYFDLSGVAVYHNDPGRNTTDPVDLAPAEGWANVPESSRPPLAAEIDVATAAEGEGPRYDLLVLAKGKAYDTVLVAPGKDASKAVATLAVGDWSDWVRAPFKLADGAETEGAFRFRLLDLSPDGTRVRLYRTDAYATDGGFCSAPELGKRLVDELGPYVHSGQTVGAHCRGDVDWETVDRLMADEAVWWSRAAGLAMESTDATLLYLHWHILDAMGHRFVQFIDPTGSQYDADKYEHYLDVVSNYYRAADRFVGAFMERFDPADTAFVVVADHGMPANRKAVSLLNAFKEKGWVAVTADGKGVDWKKSKVFFSQNHLWINLAGRDEGGIVPQEEYESLRRRVIAAMRDIKDPETDEHAMSIVLRREDGAMVGLWGDYVGDVVYCYDGGYRWSGPEVLGMGEDRVVFPCGGGNHGPMTPTFETEATSVMASLVIAGAGARAGASLPKPDQFGISTTDVAPTVATLLGIDPPAQSEGRVLREFLAGPGLPVPERRLVPTARKLVRRPSTRPRPVQLQGDVTDEE
jgi:predicted AlkP superfamily phosphohydrolase/phosphomutase